MRSILIVACVALSACAGTSDGKVALGFRGSEAWIATAPRADVLAFFDGRRTFELCDAWARHPNERRVRREIADALVRRGEPEDKCYNPTADAIRRSQQTVPPVVVNQTSPTTVNCTSYGGGRLGTQTYCNAY